MPWTLVYEHDRDGIAVAGNLVTLREAIEAGARVRVRLDYGEEGPAVYRDAAALWIREGQVYAQLSVLVSCAFQSEFHSDSATVNAEYEQAGLRFLDSPYWYFEIVSTRGDTDKSRWGIGDLKSRRRNQGKYAMKWFVDC